MPAQFSNHVRTRKRESTPGDPVEYAPDEAPRLSDDFADLRLVPDDLSGPGSGGERPAAEVIRRQSRFQLDLIAEPVIESSRRREIGAPRTSQELIACEDVCRKLQAQPLPDFTETGTSRPVL